MFSGSIFDLASFKFPDLILKTCLLICVSRREQKRSLASQATQAQLSEEDEVGDVLNIFKFALSALTLNRIRKIVLWSHFDTITLTK